jgi:hypothetical protein
VRNLLASLGVPAIGGASGDWSRDDPAGAREGERCN